MSLMSVEQSCSLIKQVNRSINSILESPLTWPCQSQFWPKRKTTHRGPQKHYIYIYWNLELSTITVYVYIYSLFFFVNPKYVFFFRYSCSSLTHYTWYDLQNFQIVRLLWPSFIIIWADGLCHFSSFHLHHPTSWLVETITWRSSVQNQRMICFWLLVVMGNQPKYVWKQHVFCL